MFAKTIIDSDVFLDMPSTTQNLYFHLSIRADDDGFINNPKKIQRIVNCSDDDLKLLVAKKFIIPFESGVVVIKHWRIHNYIQSDRYKPTVYQEEKQLLTIKKNGTYTLNNPETLAITTDTECIQDVSKLEAQVRLGKVSIGKDNIDKPNKHRYGEYKNVLLSDTEIDKLKTDFPTDWEKRIERVSEYCASTGKTYSNYLATIRVWARKEKTNTDKQYKDDNPFVPRGD